MGHERAGLLPKRKRWTDLVGQMRSAQSEGVAVANIAAKTLQNVSKRYETLFRDDAVKAVFKFLVSFSRACRAPNPQEDLRRCGINVPS